MHLGPTLIVDTFAEAFRMRFARLFVTAADDYWLDAALRALCGYGTSVIACDAEVGVEQHLTGVDGPFEPRPSGSEVGVDQHPTPDGRPGAAVMLFGFSTDQLAKSAPNRVGQCLLTCPTTAVFNGLPNSEEQIPLGKKLRFFGDGFQKSKLLNGRRYWRIPVMDGEFLVEEQLGVEKGIAGGNLIIQGVDQTTTLAAARRAVEAIAELPGVIAPFPGGVVRSGSKVGARYKGMIASTNDAFCPTLRGRVPSEMVEGANCAYEIVINGIDEPSIATAMRAALHAAAGPGIPALSAGNYGGKLGKFLFRLREVLSA